LFSVFTRELGKVLISAQSSRKLQNSKRILSPLNLCEFELYTSSAGYFKVKNAVLKASFYPLERKSAEKQLQSIQDISQVAEIIEKTIEEGEPNLSLYSLVVKSAMIIHHTANQLILEAFKVKLLGLSGTLPNLKHCFECREKRNDDKNWITQDSLHMYCTHCLPKDSMQYASVTLDTLKLLHFIATAEFEEIAKISTSAKNIEELKQLNSLLLTQLTTRDLKSEKTLLN